MRRLFVVLMKIIGVVLATLCVITIAASALGYRLVPVLSGSMRPMLEPGDLILSKPIAATDVKAGQVIIFNAPTPGNPTIVHRVLSESENQGMVTFQTKGDANNREDEFQLLLTGSTEVAQVTRSIPDAGFVVHWVAQAGPVVMTSFIVLGLISSFSIIAIWRPRDGIDGNGAVVT